MIYLLLVGLVAGLLLYAVIVARDSDVGKRGVKSRTMLDRAEVARRWQLIEQASTQGGVSLKNAVSEADKLFDFVLKAKGFRGETMAERLRRAESRLTDRNAVWRAHKLRNAYAHEVGFESVPSHAKEALSAFERGLKDLGAL